MIYWDHISILDQFDTLFCDDGDIGFFNLECSLILFPNIEQIEYFNESLKLMKNQLIENNIAKIINYIVSKMNNIINQSHLKFIVIHHSVSSLNLNNNDNCNIYQDHEKLILYKKNININVNSLNLRFDKINRGVAAIKMDQYFR